MQTKNGGLEKKTIMSHIWAPIFILWELWLKRGAVYQPISITEFLRWLCIDVIVNNTVLTWYRHFNKKTRNSYIKQKETAHIKMATSKPLTPLKPTAVVSNDSLTIFLYKYVNLTIYSLRKHVFSSIITKLLKKKPWAL